MGKVHRAVAVGTVAIWLGSGAGCGGSGGSSSHPRVEIVGQGPGGSTGSKERSVAGANPETGRCPKAGAPSGACPPDASCSAIGFASPVAYPVLAQAPRSMALGDFNADSVIDVATANASSNNLSVLLGVGDGTLESSTTFSTGAQPTQIRRGDFDGDGSADLVVYASSAGTLDFLRGNGDGTFQGPVATAVPGDQYMLVAGYFNNDELLDLAGASVNADASYPLQIFLGDGDGTFTAGASVTLDAFPSAFHSKNFDANGRFELVVASFGSKPRMFSVSGSGALGTPIELPSSTSSGGGVGSGDFDGDGDLDLAVSTFDGTQVLFGAGDSTFATAVTASAETTTLVRGADLDGDGDDDIILGQARFGPADGDQLGIVVSNGNRTFREVELVAVGAVSEAVKTGDFNGDGTIDIATANGDPANDVRILLGLEVPGCFGVGRSTGTCPADYPVYCQQADQCCPAGTSCSPDGCNSFAPECGDAATRCSTGTGCCPIGYECAGSQLCEYAGDSPPLPPDDCDGWCPEGTTCAPGGSCCPASHPVGCGDSCCLAGATCESGQCGCPSESIECGDVCCSGDTSCVDGTCVANCREPGYPVACGLTCCADGVDCVDGECACPSGYVPSCPIAGALIDFCCLDGAACGEGVDGLCGCPGGQSECGELCCSPGYACAGDECREAGGGGNCPTAEDLCSCSGCMAGTVVIECGCPPGTMQTGPEIGCGPGQTSGCVQCRCP